MRNRATGMAFAAVIAIALPATGRAFGFGGVAGVDYRRFETWVSNTHGVEPTLTLIGRLDASGSVFGPGVVDWSAGVSYDRRRTTYSLATPTGTSPAAETAIDGLGYHASLALFDTRAAMLSAVATASRTRSDSTYSQTAQPITGVTTAETYTVRARFDDRVRPILEVEASTMDSTSEGLGLATTQQTQRALGATTRYGAGPFTYRLGYQVRESEGSLAPLDYRSHTLDTAARADLGQAALFYMNGNYFLRDPTTPSPNSPRVENNHMTLGLSFDDLKRNVEYAYDHELVTAPATADRERIRHSARTMVAREFAPEWRGQASGSVSLTTERLAAVEQRGAGQTVDGLLQWTRTRAPASYRVQAGVTLGALEPASGDPSLAYGASTALSLARNGGVRTYVATYSLGYGSNLGGARGSTLTQSLIGDLSGFVAMGFRGSTRLAVSASRVDSPLFGVRASRSVSLLGSVGRGRAALNIEAGLVDGISGALATPVRTDGLFIPASFDTHSRYAVATLSVKPLRPLALSVVGRYGENSAPEVPTQREASVTGLISYFLGDTTLSIQDRYQVGGTTGFTIRTNEFFVSLTRSFGLR